MIIGILNLQGAVSEHARLLKQCHVETKLIKKNSDLDNIEGIIIPGGESTVIYELLIREGILERLRTLILNGLPVFGTCAGLVILAKDNALNMLDAQVIRNGFGRQKESFECDVDVSGLDSPFPGVFIRAPYISSVGSDVRVLSKIDDNRIIAVKERNVLATSFHPELTNDKRFHEMFINQIVK